MRRFVCVTAVVCVLAICILTTRPAGIAGADAAPLQAVGRTLIPKQDCKVRMVGEEVDIDITYDPSLELDPSRQFPKFPPPYLGLVRARFIFEAPAPERSAVGFPLGMLVENDYFAAEVEGFSAAVNGKLVEHQVEPVKSDNSSPGGPDEKWAVWQIDFPRGLTQVDVQYRVPFDTYRPWSDVSFWYVLNTGKHWAGTIGKATIRLSLGSDKQAVNLRPGDVLDKTTRGWKIEGSTLKWEYRNVEPDFDIAIRLKPLLFENEIATAVRLGKTGAEDPSSHTPFNDLARAAFATARFFSASMEDELVREYARDYGLDAEKIKEAFHAGVALHKKALSLKPGDETLHSSYGLLLYQSNETDRRADLLLDLFLEAARAERQGRRAESRPYGPHGNADLYRRAVRLWALTTDERTRETLVNLLNELMIAAFAIEQDFDWSNDPSGLAPSTLVQAQRELAGVLEAGEPVPAGPKGAPATATFAWLSASSIPILIAAGAVILIVLIVSLTLRRDTTHKS